MTRPTCLLSDDEPRARAHLRGLLATLWPELEVVGESGDGLETLELLQTVQPAILFQDICKPGMNGLEVTKADGGRTHVVFVTASDSSAVAAFEAGAVDYLRKPVDAARLAKACLRLKGRLAHARPDITP